MEDAGDGMLPPPVQPEASRPLIISHDSHETPPVTTTNSGSRRVYITTKSSSSKKSGKRPTHETEIALYKKHAYYSKMNRISFGPGRQWFAWGVVLSILSGLFFCSGIVVICVQKFHRWTGFTDKLEFLGPCFLALFVAFLGMASFMYYRAYKLSCEARRVLRLKGNDYGNGVYLVNPSTDQEIVMEDTQLKTGQKTDRATTPVNYAAYANAPYRVYRTSQVSTPTSSVANTPWAKSSLPPNSATPGPSAGAGGISYRYPSASNYNQKKGYGLPAAPTGAVMVEPEHQPPRSMPPPVPPAAVVNSSPPSTPASQLKAQGKKGSVDSLLGAEQASVTASSVTGGGSPRFSRAKKPSMPISHQQLTPTKSVTGAAASSAPPRPKPKIAGMSSLGGASLSSTSTSASTSKPAAPK